MRVPVPWVFVLAYLCGVVLQRMVPPGRPAARWIGYAGVAVFVVGTALAGWCLSLFHKSRTTTTPGEASKALVTWGPYRFSRNPMYVSLTLAYIGEAGILQQAWPLALLPLVLAYLNWVVIPVEEARLTEVFGDGYRAYRARVRRWV